MLISAQRGFLLAQTSDVSLNIYGFNMLGCSLLSRYDQKSTIFHTVSVVFAPTLAYDCLCRCECSSCSSFCVYIKFIPELYNNTGSCVLTLLSMHCSTFLPISGFLFTLCIVAYVLSPVTSAACLCVRFSAVTAEAHAQKCVFCSVSGSTSHGAFD